jgi:putative oxidoreductase
MSSNIFKTTDDWTGLVLRLTMTVVMIPHAIQHTTGGFGGFGYTKVMDYFTSTMHMPWALAFLVIVIEVLAPLLLLIGFATRLAAAFLIVLMTGIIFSSHIQFGFFVNWFGTQKGEGYEYHLLYIGLGLAAFFNGGGKYSIDRYLQ